MLYVYDKNCKTEWNSRVYSFANWDIYYLYEYAYSFMLHGDGEIYLIYFEYKEEKMCYAVMKSDIADCPKFKGLLSKGMYYDLETPYGYGGPLCDKPLSKEAKELFKAELSDYCREHNIVSQFVRFHPLLKNYEVLPEVISARYLRDTIFMDTSLSEEGIMQNMDSKNRNMVRKAIKSGVYILKKDVSEFDDFLPMYEETMKRNGADEYYTFGKDYFEALSSLSDNACIFYAMYEDKPISGAIMYYNDRYMHYHLSGTFEEYRSLAAGNLLLYEAACYAHKTGILSFHLGGGLSPEDSLFGFKKQFNKNGRASFVVGRTIFDEDAYKKLLIIRKKCNKDFNMDNNFMIQYRY